MNNTFKKYLTLIILGLAGGSIYMLPYIKYTFYDPIMNVMGITNAQSGFLLTMYAIGCVILYIPGGILSDKVSPKKAIIISLLGTSILTLIFALTFNYTVALAVWLLLAFGSGFVFWSALLKAIRMIGSDEEQGRMYGIYYAANGGSGAIISALSLKAFSGAADEKTGLFWAVIIMAIFTTVAAILLIFLLKENTSKDLSTKAEDQFHFSDLKSVLTNPAVWLVAVVCFCIYGVYSCSSYFTPYLTDVIGYSATQAGGFQIVRSYVVMLVAAPLGGWLADKVFHSTLKWFVVGAAILGVSMLIVVLIGPNANPLLIAILTLVPGLFSMCLYGIMFSTMHEVNIPIKVGGTAIAIASIIGYLPDMFLQTFFGSLLDKYENAGYNMIFLILTAFCAVTVVICALLYRSFHTVKQA